MDVQTILVPVDFSLCAASVVGHAADLARRLEADVVLLTVIEIPAGLPREVPVQLEEGGEYQPAVEALTERARDRLRPYGEIAERSGVEVQLLVREGPVAHRILEMVPEVGAGMVVMGTHGRHGFAKMMMGSVAQEVVRRSPVPVLTLRGKHHSACPAESCNWCDSGVMEVGAQLQAELDG